MASSDFGFGGGSDPINLAALSSLLQESSEADKERGATAETFNQLPKQTGASVVKLNDGSDKARADKEAAEKAKADKDSIWGEGEIPSEDAIVGVQTADKRPQPRYEFSYKQAVGTEDTFLGLSNKTPGSSDCSHLIIKIHFPGSTLKELDVDVTKNRIKAESKTHFLFTYLPVEVDGDKGDAKFDPKKHVLSITVPIVHEF